MLLDIQTMLISQTLLGMLTAFLMFIQWRSVNRDMRGVGWWAFSIAATTLGQVLIALRGVIPYVLTMVPANISLVVGMLSLLNGAGTFIGRKIPRTYGIAVLAFVAVSFTLFGHIFVAVKPRIVILNGVFLINSVICATILYRYREKTCARDARAVAATQVVFAVIAAFRLYGAFAFTVGNDWLRASSWEAFGILAMTIDQVAVVFTLMGLVDARLRSQLSKSADEKTLLVREMHHRTKNDFALVESLISLETAELPECGSNEALERVRDRIHSFALLHDRLYRGKTTGTVDAGEYLSLIAAGLVGGGSKDGRIRLRSKVDVVETDAGSAISLGLIVNELITNALKHAFPNGRSGWIDLSLSVAGTEACLEVKDDGIGLKAGYTEKPGEGLGMTLVTSLVAQIGGSMEHTSSRGKGVRTVLHFPLPRSRTATGHGTDGRA